MDRLLKKIEKGDSEISLVRENEDGKKIVNVRISLDVDQFEIIYSVLLNRIEIDLKDCIDHVGFRLVEHDISLQTKFLTNEQAIFLISSIVDIMNGVIEATNDKTKQLIELGRLNKKILLDGVE